MWQVRRAAGVLLLCGLGLAGACSSSPRDFGGDPLGGAAGDPGDPTAGTESLQPGGGNAGVGTGGTDAESGGGSAGEAGTGPIVCGDTQTSVENCGICGHMCDEEQVCVEGTCEALPDHCKDEQQNEDETDQDCGGSCKKCVEAQGCEADVHCTTDFCDASKKCAL